LLKDISRGRCKKSKKGLKLNETNQLPIYTDENIGVTKDWTAGVPFPAGEIYFSVLHSIQTGSGVHPASYPVNIRPQYEADHSSASSAEVKNGGAVFPLPHTP
jgi:hypothetical protein